jgi:pyrroloquinoline-quinone synthase
MTAQMTDADLMPPVELHARLQSVGDQFYHHRHPFHLRMHEGQLTRGQLQAWALNRYYYQSRIPIKDAIILSRSEDPEFRRAWRKRMVDHDGNRAGEGGIERWLQLAEATGLDRERVIAAREILPYLNLVSRGTLLEAAASSLTELFSGRLIALRMDAMRKHYAWLEPGLSYFQARLTQAPEDADFTLDWVTHQATTRAQQESVVAALRGKCDILWAQLDALYYAYVEPGWPPPGAFQP